MTLSGAKEENIMSKETMLILEMLENGKITSADAQKLFSALGEDDFTPVADTFAAEEDDLGVPDALPVSRPEPAPSHTRRRRYPDPSYAVAMKRAGVDFTPEQLFRLQEEGIDADRVIEMLALRRREWSFNDIVDLLVYEVSPELVLKLREIGLERLTTREIIDLVEHDVQVEYLEQIQGIHLSGLSVRDLVEFANNDVNLETVAALQAFGPLSASEIIKAAHHDLSADFIQSMAQYLPGVSIRQLIELKDHDVSPRFVEDLSEAGFSQLSVRQLIKLKDNDVDSGDAAWYRIKFGETFSTEDMLKFANHDVDRDYVEAILDCNLPEVTPAALIEMANHDVSVEDVEMALEAYGNEITPADLIEMADNR
jgi:hypothetical protein